MKRRIDIFILITLAALLTGCSSGKKRPWNTLEECIQENTKLSMQVQRLESEKTRLTEQVNTLSALDAAARLETLDTLEKIRIGKRTGFYHKENDRNNQTLVVYLEPLDTAQDYTKAIGKVNVELWNLNAAEDKAKLGEWIFEPADLHKTWGGNVFNAYYRISIPAADIPTKLTQKQEELTLKVTFTDYLSGKILTDQQTIVAKDYNRR